MSEAEFRRLAEGMEIPESVRRELTIREWQVYVLRKSGDPERTHAQVGRLMGMPTTSVYPFWKGAVAKTGVPASNPGGSNPIVRVTEAISPTGEIRTRELDRQINLALWTALSKLTDRSLLEKATYDHLQRGVKTLFEIRQLRRGEPTDIVRHEDVPKMEQIGKMLMGSLRRFGYEYKGLDGSGMPILEKDVTPGK